MKIVSITTVKNEADIIESFVRYHLNIVDEMIILNNGSTDDTNDILDKLLSEGLSLVVLNDSDKYFEPMEKYNCLLKRAVNDYDADIICPLDVDEFITCSKGNPRNIIENIPPFTYYKIKWKTYVPHESDDLENKFVPSRITHVRDECIETFYKVILTRDLSYHYNVRLTTGNHDLRFQDRFKNDINCKECNELKIAHFPLRSIEQMTSKVLVSYPNTLSRKNVNPNMSHHYPLMFNKILEKGYLEIEDVTEFAKQYSLEDNKGKEKLEYKKINLTYDPMNLDFCKNLKIMYDYNVNPMNNVLKNYVYFANEIHNFKKNDEISKKNFSIRLDDLKDEKNNLELKFKQSMIHLGDKDQEIRLMSKKIDELNEYKIKLNDVVSKLKNKDEEIRSLNMKIDELSGVLSELDNKDEEIRSLNVKIDELSGVLSELDNKDEEIRRLNKLIDGLNKNSIDLNYKRVTKLNDKLDDIADLLNKNNNTIEDYSKKVSELNLENKFLKDHPNKNRFSYLQLIIRSKQAELSLNRKLFNFFKNHDCFDVGYYLKNNPDVLDLDVGRFTPEIHYICYGFDEKRKFNEKVPIFDTKKELIEYLKQNLI